MSIRLPLLQSLSSLPLPPEMAQDTCGAASGQASGPMLQVGDLARECGKTVRAIHLYEELGLLTPQGRSKGRYRLYASTAVVRIRWIGKLQDMGFSLTDIQSLVRDWDDQRSAARTMAKMRELYAKKLAETQAHIERLKDLEREIVSSIDYLDACDVCDPERLLASCTSCEHHAHGTTVPELVSGYSVAAGTPMPTGSSPALPGLSSPSLPTPSSSSPTSSPPSGHAIDALSTSPTAGRRKSVLISRPAPPAPPPRDIP